MASPYLDETLSEELHFFLEFAATTIQRHFRGYLTRKAYYASVSLQYYPLNKSGYVNAMGEVPHSTLHLCIDMRPSDPSWNSAPQTGFNSPKLLVIGIDTLQLQFPNYS
jgi:hypothetical protein